MGRLKNYGRRSGRRGTSLLFSVCLIFLGMILFLANLNLLPITVDKIWELWPLIFVFIGMNQISRIRRPSSFIIGGAFVVLGVLYTLVELGVLQVHIHDDSWPLSVLFLALGLGGLARVLDRSTPRLPPPDFAGEPVSDSGFKPNKWGQDDDSEFGPTLENYTVMGSIKRKVESQNFEGGRLTTTMGSIEIDLRRANMPPGRPSACIDIQVYLGSVKLRVPDTWRVVFKGDNVMGKLEDRTFPPVTAPDAPQLIITGSILMGSLEVES